MIARDSLDALVFLSFDLYLCSLGIFLQSFS